MPQGPTQSPPSQPHSTVLYPSRTAPLSRYRTLSHLPSATKSVNSTVQLGYLRWTSVEGVGVGENVPRGETSPGLLFARATETVTATATAATIRARRAKRVRRPAGFASSATTVGITSILLSPGALPARPPLSSSSTSSAVTSTSDDTRSGARLEAILRFINRMSGLTLVTPPLDAATGASAPTRTGWFARRSWLLLGVASQLGDPSCRIISSRTCSLRDVGGAEAFDGVDVAFLCFASAVSQC
mmetsp:Transcript_34725/g.75995  ORF Transcript_34725/g.75995 Transcript_34725/m.75995 type:complete len:244 (-) Transcript_34725:563-1294(-)